MSRGTLISGREIKVVRSIASIHFVIARVRSMRGVRSHGEKVMSRTFMLYGENASQSPVVREPRSTPDYPTPEKQAWK